MNERVKPMAYCSVANTAVQTVLGMNGKPDTISVHDSSWLSSLGHDLETQTSSQTLPYHRLLIVHYGYGEYIHNYFMIPPESRCHHYRVPKFPSTKPGLWCQVRMESKATHPSSHVTKRVLKFREDVLHQHSLEFVPVHLFLWRNNTNWQISDGTCL